MRALRAMSEVYVDMDTCACSAMHRGYESRGQSSCFKQSDILPMGHELMCSCPWLLHQGSGVGLDLCGFPLMLGDMCCVRLCDVIHCIRFCLFFP